MRIVHPTEYALEHRAFFVQGNNSTVLTASQSGELTVIDLKNASQTTINLAKAVSAFSFSEIRNAAALIEEKTGRLFFINLQGDSSLAENSPEFIVHDPETIDGAYLACCFDRSGEYIWCAAVADGSSVEIQLRKTEGCLLLDKITIEDQ